MRVAAIQLDAEVGNLEVNLGRCERVAAEAARRGAEWIVLPEFFASGVGNLPELATTAPPPDGAPTAMLKRVASTHRVTVGGSTLVRDPDGHVRNAFFLVAPDGRLLGRHDKDLPTMWESRLYTGGADDGVIAAGGIDVALALCWELIRSDTARRVAGRADLVLSGSAWWSVPSLWPYSFTRRLQRANERCALAAPSEFAVFAGAPVVHAAHSGALRCPFLPSAFEYSGFFQGGASITDADGRVLALRRREQGTGIVLADVSPGRRRSRVVPPGAIGCSAVAPSPPPHGRSRTRSAGDATSA